MGPQQCKVCNNCLSKYKCPTCFAAYCSLPCYKRHKESPCSRKEPSSNDDILQNQPSRSFEDNEDEYGWRLRRSQLAAVAASKDIRGMLRDTKLQNLIWKIDSSLNAEQDLDKAMEGQLFQEFTNKILAVLNPQAEIPAQI